MAIPGKERISYAEAAVAVRTRFAEDLVRAIDGLGPKYPFNDVAGRRVTAVE
jgi:hypothetical protein